MLSIGIISRINAVLHMYHSVVYLLCVSINLEQQEYFAEKFKFRRQIRKFAVASNSKPRRNATKGGEAHGLHNVIHFQGCRHQVKSLIACIQLPMFRLPFAFIYIQHAQSMFFWFHKLKMLHFLIPFKSIR